MKDFSKTYSKDYKVKWVHKNFTIYSEDFIRIRSASKYKANYCEKCDYKFKIGDSVHLVSFEDIGNKVICDNCIDS